MKYKVVISYDGASYYGFQKQIGYKTIESELEKAFRNMTRTKIQVYASGRTDKGVHALNQVIHFETDILIETDKWLIGLNRRLPLDIRVLKVSKVNDNFHARHSAKSKIYMYKIAKKESTPFTEKHEVYINNIDIELLKEAANLFIGTHDFKGFCENVKGKPTIKTIYSITVKETINYYKVYFHGNSFLKYMVRSMMGILIEVGLNKKTILNINEVLESKERKHAGKTAEARGLYLYRVHY